MRTVYIRLRNGWFIMRNQKRGQPGTDFFSDLAGHTLPSQYSRFVFVVAVRRIETSGQFPIREQHRFVVIKNDVRSINDRELVFFLLCRTPTFFIGIVYSDCNLVGTMSKPYNALNDSVILSQCLSSFCK